MRRRNNAGNIALAIWLASRKCYWSEVTQLDCGSGLRNTIGHWWLFKTFYLYRALVSQADEAMNAATLPMLLCVMLADSANIKLSGIDDKNGI